VNQSFQQSIRRHDRKAEKRKQKSSLKRQQDTLWRTKYDLPMSYYLVRDE
jgi:hypothetical protein